MVLADGSVTEYGPRARLAADPHSRYARLLRASGSGADLDQLLDESGMEDA